MTFTSVFRKITKSKRTLL